MYLLFLIATVVIFLAVCAVYAKQASASLYHPLSLYLAIHALIFVIRPWYVWLADLDTIYIAYQFRPDLEAKLVALAVANLGLVAFAAASMWFGREPMTFEGSANVHARRSLRVPYVAAAALFAPFFLYSVWLGWLNRMTGRSLTNFDQATGVITSSGTNGYIFGASNMAVFLLPLCAWLFRFRPGPLIVVACGVLLMQGIGTRGPTMVAMFCLSLFFMYEKNWRWPGWRVPLLGFAALALFVTVGNDRGQAIRGLFVEQEATYLTQRDEAFLARMDFANLEMLEYLTATVPAKTGTYEYFVDQLQIFTEPVPRALWPNKPVGQPIRLFNLYDYGYPVGMTRSLPGEGWTQLGYLGVVLWCALWGGVLGSLYSRFARSQQKPVHVYAYFALLSLMIVCFRDGLLLSILRYSIFAFAPLLAMMVFQRLRGGGFATTAMPVAASDMSPTERRRLRAELADLKK